jgi:rhodanese-related sulfurtransferase
MRAIFDVRNQPSSLALSLALLTGGLPLILYGVFILRAPSISVMQASDFLNRSVSDFLLVDVRKRADYNHSHLTGAISWPAQDILSLESDAEVPQSFSERSLLLLSNNGLSSALATSRLRTLGREDTFNIRGGIQGWIAEASVYEVLTPATSRLKGGIISELPFVDLPLFKQAVVVLSLYLIKPLYTLIALVLLYVLKKETSRHLAALRWSLTTFFVGEMICWVNFQFLKVESILLEYLHSLSMVLTIAFLTFAIVEVLDKKVLKFSNPESRCVLLGICRGCIKTSNVPCAFRRLLKLSTFSLAILAVMPLLAVPSAISYNTTIFGLVRNLMHPVTIQIFEIRYCPLMAITLLMVSFFLLVQRKPKNALREKIFLSAGVGFLGFSFLRLAFLTFYRDDIVWFVFWEEATELLLVGVLAYLQWIFRRDILRPIS